MKIRYESEDGKVSGYGDEGKAKVEAYEADPWTAWKFPWEYEGHLVLIMGADRKGVDGLRFQAAALAFSKMVPVIQEAIKDADENWLASWRVRVGSPRCYGLVQLETILKETLEDAGRQ